jgi:hypothetical protein
MRKNEKSRGIKIDKRRKDEKSPSFSKLRPCHFKSV